MDDKKEKIIIPEMVGADKLEHNDLIEVENPQTDIKPNEKLIEIGDPQS